MLCNAVILPGAGKYGFNTYNLLTSVLLGFNALNAVSNLNLNVNNNNNNNNNNAAGLSSVSGNANDVTTTNNYQSMIIAIVPPIGPPIVGKNNRYYLTLYLVCKIQT